MKYYMNKMMVDLIRKTPYKRISLPKKLLAILEEGIVEINDCVFFRYFYYANPHLTDSQFTDKTEYEHSVNDFHFDDYCRNSNINHVFMFVSRLEKIVNEWNNSIPITIIISSDNDDISFSFITLHEKEIPWINPSEINCYQQPIMIIEVNTREKLGEEHSNANKENNYGL